MIYRDDIIRMAMQVGCTAHEARAWERTLTEFAAIVAAAEREACAKLEYEAGIYSKHDMAEAIRARGKK